MTQESAQHRAWPAWSLSLILHTCLLVALGTTARFVPRGANLGESRKAGIVLVHQGDGQREYVDGPAGSTPAAASLAQSAQAALPQLNELAEDQSGAGAPSVATTSALSSATAIGTAGEGVGVTPGSGRRSGYGGSTQLSVFGVTGEGSKFVFVFDRSGSMGGYGGAPLRTAKSELVRSIGQLEKTHQFQIIFYNERPHIFRPNPGEPRLVWGDETGKELASRFIGEIVASGGTQHLDALKLALGMTPDVIFFLTDADEPRLSDSDLRRIHGWNRHTAIHAIEFGHGRQSDNRSFLVRLAEQNGGQHAYVDISRL